MHLERIKARIRAGTFSFGEEFPDYRHIGRVPPGAAAWTCNQVFDAFLDHCAARVAHRDLAPLTFSSHQRILDTVWRPAIGALPFLGVRHSTLVAVVDARRWAKKTYNNALSTLRRAFEFGYCDYPDRRDPATTLRSARSRKNDRNVDPFSIHEAERLIAAIHADWGAAQGNYDEFRLFSGLRPSEQIALRVTDLDLNCGVLSVTKARVGGVDKDVTKTREDRRVLLCPRALAVMHRQLHLRERLRVAGCIDHDHLFFHETGAPFRDLRTPQVRWRRSLIRLPIRTSARTSRVTPASAGTSCSDVILCGSRASMDIAC